MRLATTEHIYSQEGDCCSDMEVHSLTVRTEDGSGGPFLVIQTSRWSFNDEKDICLLAQRLCMQFERARETYRQDEEREAREREKLQQPCEK